MTRSGIGWDSHRLVAGRPLVLGGVAVPSERGLAGHSDADVLTHAVIDALLGAAALGDIGQHFPDTDERWRDADSLALLRAVRALLDERGLAPVNLDATVICEAPKLAPHRDAMRAALAAAAGWISTRSALSSRPARGWGSSVAARGSPHRRSPRSAEVRQPVRRRV